MTTYVFDGSFEGLLTAVFDFYQYKPGAVRLESAAFFQPSLMDDDHTVVSDAEKSRCVWKKLSEKLSPDWQRRFYYAFLGETREIFSHLFSFARLVTDQPVGVSDNYGSPDVIAISKMERSVNRERHRMQAFIRFQETADGTFYAPVSPDYNVLPLISSFFRNRYADQKWMIYDLSRNYGLYYDTVNVEAVQLHEKPKLQNGSSYLADGLASGGEGLFGLLWQDYFKSPNIPARKNMKLHVRHVPKRYWHFLSEKLDAEMRFFITLVPPNEIADEVTVFKKDFADRFASNRALGVMPHITLKAPFKIPETRSGTLLKWFSESDIAMPAFTVSLNGFGVFDNKHPVVFIRCEPSEPLMQLQTELMKGFGDLLPSEIQPADSDFQPHMTIVYRDLRSEMFENAWPEYQSKSYRTAFGVNEICLLRHDGTKWKIVATKKIPST